MTPDAAGIEAALAAGLGLHSRDFSQGPFVTGCAECGGSYRTDADFDAHVAAALLPVVTQAQAEALRAAADEMDVAVSRGDMISVIPSCHKRGCQCGGGGGSEDLVIIGVANAFRTALRARADESGA